MFNVGKTTIGVWKNNWKKVFKLLHQGLSFLTPLEQK